MILLFAIGLAIAIGFIQMVKDEFDFTFFLFLLAMFGFVGTMLTLPFITSLDYTKEYAYSIKVASLKESNEVEGSFILGSGNIGNTSYYVYYEDLGNNRYKLNKIYSYDTIIVEDSSLVNSGELKVFESIPIKNIMYKLALPLSIVHKGNDSYELVVPKGTIIKEFKL